MSSELPATFPALTQVTYRADSPAAYADAVLRLVALARDSADDFTFYPISLDELDRDGLTVVGPDLQAAIAALTLVAGLAPV